MVAALSLIFLDCSENGSGNKDAGPDTAIADKGPPTEAGKTDGNKEAGPPPLSCESKCTKEAKYLCLADVTGQCVDCVSDGHCAGNPAALGPKCDADNNLCTCAADPDCASSAYGKKCNISQQMCSCETDADCKGANRCVGTLFGTAVCSPPCAKDGDCSSTSAPTCNTTTGKCVACLADKDCTSDSAPYCDTAAGQCVACTRATHCATASTGTACVDGACSCATNTDCKGPNNWGNKCIDKDSGSGVKSKTCGCDAAGDCSGNANGPACFDQFKKCSCATDTDCKKAPYDTCGFPYSGASYSHCQKACAKNEDCKDISGLNVCDTPSGKCVACLADTDCKGTNSLCSTALGLCVECKADTDCKTPGAGFCGAKGACVECKSATDCKTSTNGTVCDAEGACGCAADTDCAAPEAWGKKCVTGGSAKRCGCDADPACTGNENGPTCDSKYQRCTCATDSDCKVGAFTKCGKSFATIPFTSCQKPCTTAAACKDKLGLGVCDTAKSICIGCKTSADCTYNSFEKNCKTSDNTCLECLGDADCAPNGLGPKCDTTTGYCVCANDTECATNPNGKKCDIQVQACSCAADTDCPTGKTCTGNYVGISICE